MKKWLENYWYHYKWHTIVAVFLIAVITFLIVQGVTKETHNFQIMYAGPANLDAAKKEELSDPFRQLQGAVKDEDDRIAFASIYLLTEAQMEGEILLTDFNRANLHANRQQFNTYTATGECLIYLLDPAWYTQLKDANALVPLSDVLGATPQNALDEYGVRFKDTAFAKLFAEKFAVLPDDTVLCMRRFATGMTIGDDDAQKERYQTELAYYKKLLTFGQ